MMASCLVRSSLDREVPWVRALKTLHSHSASLWPLSLFVWNVFLLQMFFCLGSRPYWYSINSFPNFNGYTFEMYVD